MERDDLRRRSLRRRALALVNAASVVAALVVPTLVVATPAHAVNVQSATVSPGAARNGTALVLTVKTSNDVNCVKVSGGGFNAQQNGSTTSWTFNATAGAGNGTQTVTVTAFKNSGCSGASDATTTTWILDNTAPTISGSASPAPNATGWNNTNVTVTFTCNDTGSGIATCPSSTTLSSNGQNQSANGTAVDNAGNTASTSVTGINIDKTAPTISGAPTTGPNANGWYNSDVTVHWTCSDALSGLAASGCPNNNTITGEGTGLTASASVSDRAGNTTTATSSPGVNIDRTPPLTSASSLPVWNNTNVTVTLSPNDVLSGVASTLWSLDGGSTQTGTSVPVSAEGDHTLSYWSTDKAGNVETAHTIHVRIDKTPPTISHTQSPSANANGWNNTNVTVTFTCGDSLSGIASCTPQQLVTSEGHNLAVTGTAVDNAGNTTTDPATVSIDKTKPTIAAAADRPANANGWYNNDVTVTYSCGDALSGVASCSPAQTLGEGPAQTATGNVSDAAGNSASTSITGINIDKAPPLLTGMPTTPPNANGWYSGDVTIHWTCSDALSGINGGCPVDSVINGSGVGLTAGASVSDLAGNTTVATSVAVKIDRTKPVTSSDAPVAWQTSDVAVNFSASDDLSGVAHTYYTVNNGAAQEGTSVAITSEGTTTLSFWSVDAAGNVGDPGFATVKLDKSAPLISHTASPQANANGWNNTDVTVTFNCSDAVSGVASCPGQTAVTSDGAGQPVQGTAFDNAGNSASDGAIVNLDKTPPTISGAPDRAANMNGWYNSDVTVTFACSDATSGVASCTSPQLVGQGAGQSVAGTAVDKADNIATATVPGINVDKTPPTITGAPTTAPNANGWYNGNVSVEWTCNDALSGIDGLCPANSTIPGEGPALSTSAAVSDRAGNSTSASVNDVHIDRTPPVTTADPPSGWVNNAVSVSLTPSDNLSGVASTYYAVDGGAQQTGTDVSIASEGQHTLEWWSVDNAGNEETHHQASVLVDLSNPTITHDLSPVPNANGWNNTDVTVTFTCKDQPNLSGIASCTTPQQVTSEGQDQPVDGAAVDNAGNSALDTAKVSIDKTKPTITGAADRAPNENGWYNANVTVAFDCHDALSGIAGCSAPVTLGEGANQSATGNATDAADNGNTATVSGINVDETAPLLSGGPTTPANANGWYNGDVTVHWTCGDALSGVAGGCPADHLFLGEGANQQAAAQVTDLAGNHTSVVVDGINIDRTAPTTTTDAPSGWQSADVTVGLSPNDALSGVASTNYILDGGPTHDGTSANITNEGVHTLEFWSIDNAGNEETHHHVTVKIDKTAPTIMHGQQPAPNAHGWNNTPVTVTFHCDDTLSGVNSCTDPVTLSNDGGAQTTTGTAIDNAGNSAQDTANVSIDQQPPTISAARDRAPNADGWYNADVTVHFTCDDALSGVASCSSPATVGEGANQTVHGHVTDRADNVADATESGINVDKTPPTISAAPTTAPNANGWYSGDVTIHWTCNDDLSGVVACPPDKLITNEGDNLSASASVADHAGNQAIASVTGIKIDRTAPSTTASAPNDWVNNDVAVTLTATDALSGVAATYTSLDNGPAQQGTSVAITTEGTHTLSYWSVDNAGNEEGHSTIEVRIDKSAPTITHAQQPAPNANGWNNTPVTVTFDCKDALSGVQSCSDPVTLTNDGAAQPATGTARDNAGNTAQDTATVSIDQQPPTISGAPDRVPNANGWYNDDVSVTFSCADQAGLSGLASCTPTHAFGEGTGQSVTGTAVDGADNVSHATVGGINVDKTPPIISGAPTTAPNPNGWYSGDVTIHWTCGDAQSGIAGACPNDTVIKGEGSNLGATASVSDLAGNPASASVTGIKIDRTAPMTTSDAPSGWRNTPVTVHLHPTDNLATVDTTYTKLDGNDATATNALTISTEGTHTLEFWSVDKAGNEESRHSVTVQVDLTKPSISGAPTTAPNAAGWYKTPVVVHFTCADQPALSGLASCTGDQTVATSGANQSVTGVATDNAGNSNTATVSGINVDLVAPTVAVGGVAPGGSYTLGAVPRPTCTVSDALSGPADCTGTVTGGSPNGVGTYVYTAVGHDNAGNSTTRVVTYQVVYRFNGFLEPINNNGHDDDHNERGCPTTVPTSVFKAGSTVPVKFRLTNSIGASVQSNTPPVWITPVQGGRLTAAVDQSVLPAPASSGSTYRYDTDDGGQYIYNWSTKGLAAGFYYRIGVKLDDGTIYTAIIGLR